MKIKGPLPACRVGLLVTTPHPSFFNFFFRLSSLPDTTVLMMSSGPPAKDQYNFVRTSKIFRFYLELYKNKFKNLNWTSKFKISFRGLLNGGGNYQQLL